MEVSKKKIKEFRIQGDTLEMERLRARLLNTGQTLKIKKKKKLPAKYSKYVSEKLTFNPYKEKIPFPKWFSKIRKKGITEEEIFDITIQEIKLAPTKENLIVALQILNDLCRTEKGAKVVRTKLDYTLVKELQRGGKVYAR